MALSVAGRELYPVPPPPLQKRLIPMRQLARRAIDVMPASMPGPTWPSWRFNRTCDGFRSFRR